ncbi:11470_t:CDS:2, partial [Paraglomus brasilianum]
VKQLALSVITLHKTGPWKSTIRRSVKSSKEPEPFSSTGGRQKRKVPVIKPAPYLLNKTNEEEQWYAALNKPATCQESVDEYYNALQEKCIEIGAANAMPEWTKVNKFVNGIIP